MAFTRYTASTAIIAALADLPNATSGLTAAQLKAKFDENPEAFKTFINNLITALESTTALTSGAHNIGSAAITGVTGATVYAQLANLKTLLDAAILGSIPDDSLSEAKLVTVLANKINTAYPSGQYAADAGSTDAYAITLSPIPAAYYVGMTVRFKANTLNTGACTLNVNSLGAKSVKKQYNRDLTTGDIVANQIVEVIYDGSVFQLLSMSAPTLSYVSAYQSTLQSISGSSVTKITFATELVDDLAEYDNTTSTFTASVAGIIVIDAAVYWKNTQVDGNTTNIFVYKNGSVHRVLSDQKAGGAGFSQSHGTSIVSVAAGDTIEIRAFTAGSNDTLTGAENTYLTISMLRRT